MRYIQRFPFPDCNNRLNHPATRHQEAIDDAINKAATMAEEKKNEALADPDGFIATHGKETYDIVIKQLELFKAKVS